MDFDDAKENIQPLAQGRNASILQASLKIDSPHELLAQRKEYEKEIRSYSGDDPLSAWYNYIEWIEQSFPSGGKESGLQEVLSKCLAKLESDQQYNQDRRMIKLYIKFIDSHKDPAECYQQLFNAGIGSMVADFYIAWAYCYDLVGNTRKADEVFRRGIACRAQPLEELQEAHQHFGFTVAQRLMYRDDDSVKEETDRQLQERRLALASLRGHRRKQLVGSMRTGAAVKNTMPGVVKSEGPTTSSHRSNNVQVPVFKDENESPNLLVSQPTEPTETVIPPLEGKSVVRSIIDDARNQENQKEPGPWNKAHLRKKGKLFGKTTLTNDLGFEIHEDDKSEIKELVFKPCMPPIPILESEIKFDKPFIYPKNFCKRSLPIKGWETPVTTEEEPDKNTIPQYNKCKLYPRPNVEFQPEEFKAFNIMKKLNIQSDFVKERTIYWGCGPDYNIRLYPHFAKQSKPQIRDAMDEPYVPDYIIDTNLNLKVALYEIYNKEEKVERQFEEIMALKRKRMNETIITTTDMEETMCITNERQQRRKSFFPMRKSLAPSAMKASRKVSLMPECIELNESEIKEDNSGKSVVRDIAKPSIVTIFEDSNSDGAAKLENIPKITINNQTEDFVKPMKTSSKKDEEEPSTSSSSSNKPLQLEEDFQFKTPALPFINPAASSTLAISNKICFEIFEDDTASQKPSSSTVPTPDFGCGSGGFFDPDETCSTQTFNVFLKSQSVSTPNATAKSQPQRLFGNVLKEVGFTQPEKQEEQQNVSPVTNDLPSESSPSAAAGYSPVRQQLSTILEISEHGTTQGTHTTGATTKSTLSSPEFEIESRVQSTTSNTPSNGAALETVKESSGEISTITSGNVDELMNSLHIQNKADTSKQYQQHLATPAAVRLQKKSENGGLNFSIFEDTMEKNDQQVGNFSRLQEKEDTAAGFVYKQLPSIRFQDDKTETISKMLMAPLQAVQFPEDKTETISKMLMAPLQAVQFPEDKTETISKMLMQPMQPIQFPEDKTETISKIFLAPSQPRKFDDIDNSLIQKSQRKEIIPDTPMSQDDSFQFFGETPPKGGAKIGKLVEKEEFSAAKLRTAADSRTPLTFDPKRFCNKDTPDIQKSKTRQTVLFEDELQSQNISKTNKEIPQKQQKFNLRDSFMPDFSVIEDSQPSKPILPPTKTSKSVLRDSFIPDFSIIEDSQPQNQQKRLAMNPSNNSFLADFSIIQDSQPPQKQPPSQTKQIKVTNTSFQPDFTHIPETQANDSVILQSQTMEPRLLKQNSMKSSLQSSILNDYSRTTTTDKPAQDTNAANHWKQTPNPKSMANQTQEGTNLKNILMDTYMKDFSEINEPPPIPKDVKEMSMVQPSRNNSSLRFLNESLQQKPQKDENNSKSINNKSIQFSTSSKDTKLSFRETSLAKKSPAKENKHQGSRGFGSNEKYFELNCETDMFGTNMSMIKNSTWLPNHGPNKETKQLSNIQEDSLHIKAENISPYVSASTSNMAGHQTSKSSSSTSSSSKPKLSFFDNSHNFSIDISATELAAMKMSQKQQAAQSKHKAIVITESPEKDEDCELSIYYKKTPKTPKAQVHIWDDAEAFKTPANNNRHMYAEPDLNQTHQVIEQMCIDPNVNPFNVDLIHAFLEQNYFITYLESLPSCMLVGCIQRLKQSSIINVNGVKFDVVKLIGEGAYGAVFCGKEIDTGKVVAMKQEKPPNFWEYYICLEIQARIQVDEMLPAYMMIDNALIGNNSSILISNFSQYGSLISVCNKIKKHTLKNVDEYVVMLMACELLEIMDHLHAVNIIHADIKADNILLINKLTFPSNERFLQLIDFGVSIDMKLFKTGQTFSFIHNDNSFKCPEMREQRPWTYQLDLYGLAGVFHVLLFGKYMEIERKSNGLWMHKTHVPRYFNKSLWDTIFKTLLNIRDCNSMPNLQELRALLKEEIAVKEKYVAKMVLEFNKALNN